MAQAVSQNENSNLDVALTMLNLDTNIVVQSGDTNTNNQEDFSNLINTLNANVEEAQTNFIDLAVKSNISSINKLAIDENADSNTNLDLTTQTRNIKIKTEQTSDNDIDLKAEINIDSSFENQTLMDSINNILSIIGIDFSKINELFEPNSKLKEEFENLLSAFNEQFSQAESFSDMTNVINNFLSELESSGLSLIQKDKISQAFKGIEKFVIKVQNDYVLKENNIITDAKNIIDNINSKVYEKIQNDNTTVKQLNQIVDKINEIADFIIENNSENFAPILTESIDKIKTSIEDLFNNNLIDEAVFDVMSSTNNETIKNNILNNLEILEQNYSIEPKNKIDTTIVNDSINSIKSELAELKNNTIFNNENSSSIMQKLNNIKTNLDNYKVDSASKKEILDSLNNLKNDSEISLDDIAEIEDIINRLNSVKNTKETLNSLNKTNNNKITLNEKSNFSSFKKDGLEKIQDEILLESKYSKIPNSSGTLSVSDEVAKMAINEQSTILSNQNTQIQSHFIYDNGVVKNNNITLNKEITGAKFNLENSDVLNQISEKFNQLKDATGHKINLVLRPNDLGRVSIELKSDNGGLSTNIIAQNEQVRAYIEKNIHTLRQSLADSGVNVNNIQIKTAGESQSSTYEGNSNSSNQQFSEQQNQNNNQNKHHFNKKDELKNFGNYDLQFAKDFSNVLNKTLSYNLN